MLNNLACISEFLAFIYNFISHAFVSEMNAVSALLSPGSSETSVSVCGAGLDVRVHAAGIQQGAKGSTQPSDYLFFMAL